MNKLSGVDIIKKLNPNPIVANILKIIIIKKLLIMFF